jgi:hypothetical protein
MASIPIVTTMCSNDTAHAGCLVPRKNATDRQTDMDGPMKCSSLTLKREERLRTDEISGSHGGEKNYGGPQVVNH